MEAEERAEGLRTALEELRSEVAARQSALEERLRESEHGHAAASHIASGVVAGLRTELEEARASASEEGMHASERVAAGGVEGLQHAVDAEKERADGLRAALGEEKELRSEVEVSTLNSQSPTLHPQPSTLDPQPSTLNPQP